MMINSQNPFIREDVMEQYYDLLKFSKQESANEEIIEKIALAKNDDIFSCIRQNFYRVDNNILEISNNLSERDLTMIRIGLLIGLVETDNVENFYKRL